VFTCTRYIIPVEVKAKQNLKAKSLKAYHQCFKPELSIRTAMTDYKAEGWLLKIPLYALTNHLPQMAKDFG
jgi:uncharacterized protein